MTTPAPVLVDTDVLICAEDAFDQTKQQRALLWLDYLWRQRMGRLSTQALDEFYVNLTSKMNPPMPMGDARAKVRRYAAWHPWQIDQATVETAWGFEANHALPYKDCLMLAAAQHMGCEYMLTEALVHGQRFGAVTVINPSKQPFEWLQNL